MIYVNSLLNGWILPIGGASAVKGLRLQPAQQACFTNIVTLKCPRGKVCVLLLKITNLKAINTSLNPFNLLKEVPSTF